MSKHKTFKRVVAHPKFYAMVAGKMAHVVAGTAVTVTQAEIDRHGAKLIDPTKAATLKDGEMVDSSGAPAEAQEALATANVELETEREKTKVLDGQVAELDKTVKAGEKSLADTVKANAAALKKSEGQITSLNAQVKALTDAAKKTKK